MTQTVNRGTRVADLAAAADRIRHHILDMGEVQGQGYVGQGLGFADVRNHLTSPRLRATMGTDIFAFHGYTDVRLVFAPAAGKPGKQLVTALGLHRVWERAPQIMASAAPAA